MKLLGIENRYHWTEGINYFLTFRSPYILTCMDPSVEARIHVVSWNREPVVSLQPSRGSHAGYMGPESIYPEGFHPGLQMSGSIPSRGISGRI